MILGFRAYREATSFIGSVVPLQWGGNWMDGKGGALAGVILG